MRVEFTVPMEGPRTDLHPKGVSRRPGHAETVPDDEGLRLVERGMAVEVDDDGYPVNVTTSERARVAAEAEAANRSPPIERAVSTPAKPVERAVTQPTPDKPATPKGAAGASGGKASAKA